MTRHTRGRRRYRKSVDRRVQVFSESAAIRAPSGSLASSPSPASNKLASKRPLAPNTSNATKEASMPDLVFSRLHPPRPLAADSVTQLMARLMSADAPRPLVFEVHASADGVTHLVGYPSAAAPRLKRLLRGHLPGLALEPATRPDVAAVSRAVAHPGVLPLSDTDPEQVASAIYRALAARRGEEHVALQLILGRTHAAHSVSAKSADPMQPLASLVFEGVRAVEPETRRRLQQRVGQPTTATTLRIGVTAGTQKRTGALVWEVFGALQHLQSPGLRLSHNYDSSSRWRAATSEQPVGLVGVGQRDRLRHHGPRVSGAERLHPGRRRWRGW